MSHQVSGRPHRATRGLIIKQTLQCAVIMAVYLWLLYQMKQSLRREFGEERSGWSILGHQGIVGSSTYSDDFEVYGFDMTGEPDKTKDDEGNEDDEWAKVVFGEMEEKPSSNGVNQTTHKAKSEIQKQDNEKSGGNEETRHIPDRMKAGKLPVKDHEFSGKNISTDAKAKDEESKFDHVELADVEKSEGKASRKAPEERTSRNMTDTKASQKTDDDDSDNNFWNRKQNLAQDEEGWRCEIDKNCTPTQRSVILAKKLFQEYMSRLNPQSLDWQHSMAQGVVANVEKEDRGVLTLKPGSENGQENRKPAATW